MLLLLSAGLATAQTNPPPVSYVRSYVNDVPNQPLVSVSVYGASNVSCFTIEESLPSPATAVNVSGDGVYLPALNVIRWGPYFNTVSASVSYRLTGLPASYPVNGGSWMDGQWYFSPGVTLITVLPASGGSVPTAPPQVATPVIGVAVPLTIQAESASYGGGLSIDTNYAGFNGSGFANFPLSGGFLQFTGVGGGFGGLATLSIRFALGATNTRSGLLIVNGVSQGITFSPTGNWNNWTSQVVNIPLGSGNTNIVRFESNGQDLANVDEITVTPGTNGISANFQISCATPGASIYYTLDGSLPTQSSVLYTGAVPLVAVSVIRAVAFTNGWTPSAASVAYYGPPAVPANAQVTRSVNTTIPTAPVVTLSVTPGTNASCVAVAESLPPGVGAINVSSGGNYVASNNVVLWGPFFGTNAQMLSYQAAGPPGTYPVRAAWSVDGVGGSEAVGTNIVIASATGNLVPTPPPQVAAPSFLPASGTNVPVSVTVTDATPGAVIYYTLDGTLPTPSAMLYTGKVSLATASVLRAVAFTNGWTPSVASVACYGPPAVPANAQVARSLNTSVPTAPVVTFNVTPGASAQCVAVTETLPPGIGAINVSSGGNYIASNNVVKWGPFFGTNGMSLSYQAVGQPGVYPVSASWSVDGVGGSEATGMNLVVASGTGSLIPTAPQPVPTPVLTPAVASNLPVTVSISCSDAQAQIYYTTDGTLPTQSSTPYTTALHYNTRTTLRAVAFHTGYLPSVSAVGEYSPVLTTNTVAAAHSISGNGGFLPTVSLTATPQGAVSCYAVVEPIPTGLTPSGLSGDGIWDSMAGVIRWGPYLDNQPRVFSYNIGGASGTYPLSGQVSVNGYSAGTTGASSVQINANDIGSPPVTNLAACATDHLTYNVNINPSPGVVTVTAASGTVSWGDGTQTAITQPVMTLQKSYSVAGTYPIVIAADWTGLAGSVPVSGHATKTDSVQVVTTCLAPQIATQPSNQVALVGATVQFTVSASSSAPMSYQWYFNQTFPIVGTVFSTLTLPNIALESAGHYSVVITNAFGSVTSRVASLTLVTPLISSPVRGTNGRVALTFEGLPNATTRIWATTNLASSASWQPIFTNTTTSTNGAWQFTDTNAMGYPMRFYRFSTP